MYCSKCGSPNANDARFCSACGQTMGAVAPASSPGTVSPPPPPPPAASQPFTPGTAPGQQPAHYMDPRQAAAVQPILPPPPAYYASPSPQMGMQPGQPVYVDPRIRSGVGAPGVPGGKQYAVGKSPGLAVFLSFLIPGLGQFYCGANGKGGIMLGLYLFSWLLMAAYIGFVTMPGVWIWSMIDAYNVASGKAPLS